MTEKCTSKLIDEPILGSEEQVPLEYKWKDFNIPIFVSIAPVIIYLGVFGLMKLDECPAEPAVPLIMPVLAMFMSFELFQLALTFSFSSIWRKFGIFGLWDKSTEVSQNMEMKYNFIFKLHCLTTFFASWDLFLSSNVIFGSDLHKCSGFVVWLILLVVTCYLIMFRVHLKFFHK